MNARETACNLSKKLEKAHEECEGYKNGQAQLQSICDGLQDTISKYAAERKLLKVDNALLRRKIENHIIMSEDFKTEYNTWLDKLNKEVDDGTGKSGQI